jgi:hypothetical protein
MEYSSQQSEFNPETPVLPEQGYTESDMGQQGMQYQSSPMTNQYQSSPMTNQYQSSPMTNFKTSIINAIMRNNKFMTSPLWRQMSTDQKNEAIRNALMEVANMPNLSTIRFKEAFMANVNTASINAKSIFNPSSWFSSSSTQKNYGGKMRRRYRKRKTHRRR